MMKSLRHYLPESFNTYTDPADSTSPINGEQRRNDPAPGLTENAEELNIGDDVIITGNVYFKGATGIIDSFDSQKAFVVVNLFNHGKRSFHCSDVSYNDYADSDEEEMDMYDRDPDARDWSADMDEAVDYDKHSFVGKIRRGHELRSKVDSTWQDACDAEKRGDKKGADRSFERHVKYTNLERPGTWRKVEEDAGKYDILDVSLQEWAKQLKQRYPDAKIYRAPEEEGGCHDAYVGKQWVGDWDGGDENPGRILKQVTETNQDMVGESTQLSDIKRLAGLS